MNLILTLTSKNWSAIANYEVLYSYNKNNNIVCLPSIIFRPTPFNVACETRRVCVCYRAGRQGGIGLKGWVQ